MSLLIFWLITIILVPNILCATHICRFKPNSRILTTHPSTTPIWPRLRYRLTHCERILQWKPWTFGVPDSHRHCTLLKPTFSLPTAPPDLTVRASPPLERSPTTPVLRTGNSNLQFTIYNQIPNSKFQNWKLKHWKFNVLIFNFEI